MTWHDARRQVAGDTGERTTEKDEVCVVKMTTALRKALGATAYRQPDIFLRAVERFSLRLAKALEDGYVEASREAHGEP